MAERKTIRLRHARRKGNWSEHFYDGSLKVKDGVIEVSETRLERVQRAWVFGFRKTHDGRVIANLNSHIASELARYEEPTPTTVVETAQSGEEKTSEEGLDGGGLATGEDGIRSSEPTRNVGIPEIWLRGGGSDEPPVEGDSDRPSD